MKVIFSIGAATKSVAQNTLLVSQIDIIEYKSGLLYQLDQKEEKERLFQRETYANAPVSQSQMFLNSDYRVSIPARIGCLEGPVQQRSFYCIDVASYVLMMRLLRISL